MRRVFAAASSKQGGAQSGERCDQARIVEKHWTSRAFAYRVFKPANGEAEADAATMRKRTHDDDEKFRPPPGIDR